jgi:DHA2 family multidrug resistance protein
MRQLGGSFGIALITTFMARQNMIHRDALVSKLDVNSPYIQQRVHAIQQNFINKGMNTESALKSSYSSLDHMVTKQAAVLSYMDVFIYLSIMFLICVPFVLMVKANKKKKIDLSEAMH